MLIFFLLHIGPHPLDVSYLLTETTKLAGGLHLFSWQVRRGQCGWSRQLGTSLASIAVLEMFNTLLSTSFHSGVFFFFASLYPRSPMSVFFFFFSFLNVQWTNYLCLVVCGINQIWHQFLDENLIIMCNCTRNINCVTVSQLNFCFSPPPPPLLGCRQFKGRPQPITCVHLTLSASTSSLISTDLVTLSIHK